MEVEITTTAFEDGVAVDQKDGGEKSAPGVNEVPVDDAVLYTTSGGAEVQRGESRGPDQGVMFKNDTTATGGSGAATQGKGFGSDERGASIQTGAADGAQKVEKISKGPAAVVEKDRVFLR